MSFFNVASTFKPFNHTFQTNTIIQTIEKPIPKHPNQPHTTIQQTSIANTGNLEKQKWVMKILPWKQPGP